MARARALGFPALNPVLPDLLAWVKDANWPVAGPVAAVLTKAGPEIAPPLRHILAGGDAIWKYWALTHVVAHLRPEVLAALEGDLIRLATEPAPEDRREEVDVAARDVLSPRGA